MSENTIFLRCNHCNNEWETESTKWFVNCTSCLLKVEVKKCETEISKEYLEKQEELEKQRQQTRSKSRSKELSTQMKIKSNYLCQICEQETFEDKHGNNYVESHHIISIEENGPDAPENILIVCPNCHFVFRRGCENAQVEIYKIIKKKKLFSDFRTLREFGVITSEMYEEILKDQGNF